MNEAKVLEFKAEQGEMEFEGMETSAMNNDLAKGIIIGFLMGSTTGLTLWMVERKKRKDLLKQLQITNHVAAELAQGNTQTVYNKKEIDLANKVMKNPDDLILEVMSNIDKGKFMSKKEKKVWKETMNNLVDLTVIWQNKKLEAVKKETVLSEQQVTETLEEK